MNVHGIMSIFGYKYFPDLVICRSKGKTITLIVNPIKDMSEMICIMVIQFWIKTDDPSTIHAVIKDINGRQCRK